MSGDASSDKIEGREVRVGKSKRCCMQLLQASQLVADHGTYTDDDGFVTRGLSIQTISCRPLAAGDTNPLSPLT